MPRVTALRAARRGVALYIDGEFACTVSESLITGWRLFNGRELADDEVAEIRAAASAERVVDDAYRLLGHRARSRAELRRRLLAKGHDEAGIEAVLDRLADEDHLDDAAFARSYVADKRRFSGWGEDRLRHGLRELGVEAAVIEEAVTDEGDRDAELERAVAVLRRRSPPAAQDEAARRRALQALARRGFATSVAYEAVRRWTNG